MPYVSPERVARAREIDLYSYLKANEPQELVHCSGSEFSTRTHDSLKISNGKWFWWSRGIGGKTALDFLIYVRGMDFVSAVELLTGTEARSVSTPPISVSKPKKKYEKLYLPPHHFNCKTSKEYLLSRGIDEAIIDECIAKRMIAEDKKGNVIFIGYDEKGEAKHACMRETGGENGRKDMAGSDKRYAFRFLAGKENATVRVFEGAIDLLSYATVLKEIGKDFHDENLISLSGIYLPKQKIEDSKIPHPLEYYLATHENTKQICLYLDNDYAGKRGADALQVILGASYDVRYIPPPVGKDYNDYLKWKRKTESEIQSQDVLQNQISKEGRTQNESSDQKR